MEQNMLEYANQLEFKRWAKRNGASYGDFYFDNIYGVDGSTQRNIKGLVANGTITWGKALEIVKKHFSRRVNKFQES